MKLTPVLTEKSLSEAKGGKYSFWVPTGLNKIEIRTLISKVFEVSVTSVKTINSKKLFKRNNKGKYQVIAAKKKAIVELKKGEKIDLFEEDVKKS